MRGRPNPFAYLLALLASLIFAAYPAAAQSILRDAETESLLRDMLAPIVEASELEPGNVEIVLINDGSINAFVAGGQAIYVHSGLLGAADTANEVQGVLAHELGHITAGHAVRFEERTKAANGSAWARCWQAQGTRASGSSPPASRPRSAASSRSTAIRKPRPTLPGSATFRARAYRARG